MAINPGYCGTARKYSFRKRPGRQFRCPECKGVLLEGNAEEIYTRCKHCGMWVHIIKNQLTLMPKTK